MRKKLEDIQFQLNKMKSDIEKEKRDIIQADKEGKLKEEERLKQYQAMRGARVSDETVCQRFTTSLVKLMN